MQEPNPNLRPTALAGRPFAAMRALGLSALLAAAPLSLLGCDDGDDGDDGDAAVAGDGDGDGDAGGCPAPEDITTLLPDSIECIGLYSDVANKTVAGGVQSFAPAHKLWSDGAEKARWIYLPEGGVIDGSDADDWKFPIGTRLYKEFSWKGHRVETRVFWKAPSGIWLKGAYHWNEDETDATRFAGGEVDVAGDTYEIPSGKMCDQCHKGRTDRALGFEAVLLGLPGAQGVSLKSLVDDGLLSGHDGATELSLGDDGTGVGGEALAWLHVNCGTSCHNGFPNSEAYKTDMRLRLTHDQLDGSSLSGVDGVTTTIDLPSMTRRWQDWTRIVPGKPDESLIYFLLSNRDPANPEDRMPPIASRVAPEEGAPLIRSWIEAMGDGPSDAGMMMDGAMMDADAGM